MIINYELELKLQYSILDKLNIEQFLDRTQNVEELMKIIEIEADKTLLPDDFNGNVFNWLDIHDFSKYLEDRFGKHVEEHIVVEHFYY